MVQAQPLNPARTPQAALRGDDVFTVIAPDGRANPATDPKLGLEMERKLHATMVRTRLIDTSTGDIESGFDVYAGDVAVNYVPHDGVTIALRFQHLRQVSDESAGMEVLGYVRNTVMLGIVGRFPDRLAGEVPLRSSMRVDRSDTTAVGEEVAPAEAPGGGGGAP